MGRRIDEPLQAVRNQGDAERQCKLQQDYTTIPRVDQCTVRFSIYGTWFSRNELQIE